MRRTTIVAIMCLGASAACAGLPAPSLRVELKKAEDSAVLTSASSSTVVTITSKSGIGGARVVRTSKVWPARLAIRLGVKGLESFWVENGTIHISTSLKSPKRVPFWNVGKNDRQPDAPDGMIDIALTRTEEFVEIVIPRELTEANPQEISFGWVDFFRD